MRLPLFTHTVERFAEIVSFILPLNICYCPKLIYEIRALVLIVLQHFVQFKFREKNPLSSIEQRRDHRHSEYGGEGSGVEVVATWGQWCCGCVRDDIMCLFVCLFVWMCIKTDS